MDPIFIRLLERLLIVLFSGLSIYWGYRLFAIATEKQGDFKMGSGMIKVHLANVAPGIYFSLFGSLLLIFSMTSQVDFTYEPDNSKSSLSRGIASESDIDIAYFSFDNLTPEQIMLAQSSLTVKKLLSPFTYSKDAQSLVSEDNFEKLKSEFAEVQYEPYWKKRILESHDLVDLYLIADVLVYYLQSIETRCESDLPTE